MKYNVWIKYLGSRCMSVDAKNESEAYQKITHEIMENRLKGLEIKIESVEPTDEIEENLKRISKRQIRFDRPEKTIVI